MNFKSKNMINYDFKKMYANKPLFISKLVLVLILLYSAIRVVLPSGDIGNGQDEISAGDKTERKASEKMQLPTLSREDYAQISKNNPFNRSGQTTASNRRVSTNDSFDFGRSVSEELGLLLFGTVTGSPSIARAIIKDVNANASDYYKIGQNVGGALIEGIEDDAVVLFHDNQIKRLCIETWKSKNAKSNRMTISTADINSNKASATNVSASNNKTYYKKRIEQIEKVLAKTIIEPYVVKGQARGLKVTGLEKMDLAAIIGIKNGDVIRSVNGQSVTSKQKAFQVFKKARYQKSLDMDLLRDNKSEKLSFTF